MIGEVLLPEFDHEMANTRKTLERVPEDKFGWRPHEKSPTMIWLAGHVANIPSYGPVTLSTEFFDLEAPFERPKEPRSRNELLDGFDANVKSCRAAIAAASDEQFRTAWTLKAGAKTIFTMPRVAVLRSMMMSHLIHHRAQLGVYLRLNDVPVPAIYGPSADEPI